MLNVENFFLLSLLIIFALFKHTYIYIMDKYTALAIVEEFQSWRRSQPPYDNDGDDPKKYKRFPYSGETLGRALDVVINFCKGKFEPAQKLTEIFAEDEEDGIPTLP